MTASAAWARWLPPLLAAPFAGSFLGVLVRRLPRDRPVVLARSACETCGTALRPRDLIPLVSFAALRGRCRTCGSAIGSFHPAVELAAVAVAVAALLANGDPGWTWAGCALGWTLLALGWIDAEHMILPDVLTLPLIPAGLLATFLLADPGEGLDMVADGALGAAIGYGALRGLGLGYERLRGREGIGQGDAKLLAASGAWLGWGALPWVVLLAATTGLLLALWGRLRGRGLNAATALPFGPCLALASFAVWLYVARDAACCGALPY